MNDTDHVTWRELNLTVGALKTDIGAIKTDVSEIKADVKDMRGQSWLGPRGRDLVSAGSWLAATCAILLAIFFH